MGEELPASKVAEPLDLSLQFENLRRKVAVDLPVLARQLFYLAAQSGGVLADQWIIC